MGFDEPKPSSSSGAAVVVAAGVILVFICGLLAVAGAGFFYVRSARTESMVLAERHQAVAQRQLALAEAARAQVEIQRATAQLQHAATQLRQASPAVTPDPRLKFEVTLDREGTASIDGQAIGLAELRARLEKLKEETSNAFSVRISVDPECPVKQLVSVLDVCEDVGVIDFRVALPGGPRSSGEGGVDN